MANWIFFGVGVLSSVLTGFSYLRSAVGYTRYGRNSVSWFYKTLAWSPLVVGPTLLLGGAVLAGTGRSRLSWLIIASGASCLFVLGYLLLLNEIRDRIRRYPGDGPIKFAFRVNIRDGVVREIAGDVGRKIGGMLAARIDMPQASPSAIAEALYLEFSQRGSPPWWTERSFRDFAKSKVDAGIWVSASVYTDDADGTRLKEAVVAVLWEFGMTSVVEEPPVRGSWFQRFWARTREVGGNESVRERLAKVEEAIHLEHLGKRRAEIDKTKAESVTALIGAMKEQENAVVRIGSIIMIKTKGDLVVWTISEMEAAALEKNSDLLGDPVEALKFLRGSRQMEKSTDLQSSIGDALSD